MTDSHLAWAEFLDPETDESQYSRVDRMIKLYNELTMVEKDSFHAEIGVERRQVSRELLERLREAAMTLRKPPYQVSEELLEQRSALMAKINAKNDRIARLESLIEKLKAGETDEAGAAQEQRQGQAAQSASDQDGLNPFDAVGSAPGRSSARGRSGDDGSYGVSSQDESESAAAVTPDATDKDVPQAVPAQVKKRRVIAEQPPAQGEFADSKAHKQQDGQQDEPSDESAQSVTDDSSAEHNQPEQAQAVIIETADPLSDIDANYSDDDEEEEEEEDDIPEDIFPHDDEPEAPVDPSVHIDSN